MTVYQNIVVHAALLSAGRFRYVAEIDAILTIGGSRPKAVLRFSKLDAPKRSDGRR